MRKLCYSVLLGSSLLLASEAQSAELPNQAVLKYSSSYNIPATMTFTRSGNRYKVVSHIRVPLYQIRFESGGTIEGDTLKPRYYRDVRNGKLYAEAKFSGNRITYGRAGETETETVGGPVMDLFTLAWQLAATDAQLPSNLRITNGKNIYRAGLLNHEGSSQFKLGSGKTPITSYRMKRGEDTVSYAFATELGYIPAQISYTDESKTYNLKLTSLTIDGKKVTP